MQPRIEDGKLFIPVPITPSLNQIIQWKGSGRSKVRGARYKKHRDEQEKAIRACIDILRLRIDGHWANKIRLSAYRCNVSRQGRAMDETNIRGGLKPTEDALVNAGIIPDDSPKHVVWGEAKELRPKQLDELGFTAPATWLVIERLS